MTSVSSNNRWPDECKMRGTAPNSVDVNAGLAKSMLHLCVVSHLREIRNSVLPSMTYASIHDGFLFKRTGRGTAKRAEIGSSPPPNRKR
eukprot:6358758-Alexandrium_andersonii.AAC.1